MDKRSGWGHLTRLDLTVMSLSACLVAMLFALQLNLSALSSYRGSILYLTPADARHNNIWATRPDSLPDAHQLTFSPTGIQSFAVSPNGKWVVYAEYQNEGATRDTHLILLNMITRQTRPLIPCIDSSCENPVFSPDSRYVAYERIDLNSDLPGVPASPARIWLVDLYHPELNERLLDPDEQVLGMMARWSPDGRSLAVLDRSEGGIRLYDMRRGTSTFIARSYTSSGTFSPDNLSIVFPALDESDGDARTVLRQYHLGDGVLETLKTDVTNFRPVSAAHSPNGMYLAALHLTEEARCYSGPALYLARILDAGALQTITATDYCAQVLSWDPTGIRLYLQRVITDDAGISQSEIWLYSPDTNTAHRLIANAYHPRWLP